MGANLEASKRYQKADRFRMTCFYCNKSSKWTESKDEARAARDSHNQKVHNIS